MLDAKKVANEDNPTADGELDHALDDISQTLLKLAQDQWIERYGKQEAQAMMLDLTLRLCLGTILGMHGTKREIAAPLLWEHVKRLGDEALADTLAQEPELIVAV